MSTHKHGEQPIAVKEWWDHWWPRSPVAEIAGGKSRPKPNAQFWYRNYWKPRELSAWMYELVRRLPNTRIPIPVEASRVLKRLPPYPKLTPEHKQILFIIVSRELNPRLVLQEQSVIGASLMPAWKEGQASKLGNWSQVAALEKPVDAYTQEDRRYGRTPARKFLPLILSACKIMSMSSNRRVKFLQCLPDPQTHELSGASFSMIEIQRAIEEALAQGRIGSPAST